MKNRRRKIMISPHFQTQFILRLSGWVMLSTVLTAVIAALTIAVTDERLAGDFFYVQRIAGSSPKWMSLWEILLPALAVALPVNLGLTILFALFYSQRLAGPIHRLHQDMMRAAHGEKIKLPFHLRESDELQDLAHAFDSLLRRMEEKG